MRIRKVKDGWRITGGLLKTKDDMFAAAAAILHAVNGSTALKKEVPKGYSAADKLMRMKKP